MAWFHQRRWCFGWYRWPSSIKEGGVLGGIDDIAPSKKVVFWVV